MPRSPEFGNIQALRAGAAFLVAIGHGARPGTVPQWLATFLGWSAYAGVDLFFVISGFIVSHAAVRAGGRVEREGRLRSAFAFACRRIFRIYPPYWIALAVAIWFGPQLHIAVTGWPHSSLIAMATLTTMWITPLSPAWTLAFEVYFYTALTIIILIAGQRVSAAIMLWVILQVAWIEAPHLGWPNWGIGSNELVFEFGLGWLAGELVKRTDGALGWLSGVVAVPFLGVGVWLTANLGLLGSPARVATFGIGSGLLLYAMLRLELSGGRAPVWLQNVGDVSYSIYLWHMIVFAAVYDLVAASPLVFVVALSGLIAWGFVCQPLSRSPRRK